MSVLGATAITYTLTTPPYRDTVFHVMRLLSLPIVLVIFLVLPTASLAVEQQPVAVSAFDLHAPITSYNQATGEFEASGGVSATFDNNTLTADSVKGNEQTREMSAENFRLHVERWYMQGVQLATRQVPIPGPPGQIPLAYVVQKGFLTTCSKEHPDFKITAQRLTVLPNQRATMRHASVWIGGVRLITLPKLTLRLHQGTSNESIFPRPSYDSRDGLTLSLDQQINNSDRFAIILDVRQTTHTGLQGGMRTNLLLRGKQSSTRATALTDLRLRPVVFPSLHKSDLVCPPTFAPDSFSGQLMAFANYDQRRRIFDIDAKELLVSTSPELGVRWITNPSRVSGIGVSAYLAGQASWGSFREAETSQSHSRADARMTLTTVPIPVFGRFFLQPAAYVRQSHYNDGESYGNRGISADLSTSFGRAFISGRVLAYNASGSSPFEFDDIDRFRELHTSFLYTGKREGFGMILRYGLDKRSLYDWELSYTRRLHCLEPTVTWENRFGLFRIDLKAIGLD